MQLRGKSMLGGKGHFMPRPEEEVKGQSKKGAEEKEGKKTLLLQRGIEIKDILFFFLFICLFFSFLSFLFFNITYYSECDNNVSFLDICIYY